MVYDAMYDFNPCFSQNISTNILSARFQASLEKHINQQGWNVDDINAMLYESVIYHADGHIERLEIDFDSTETVSSEVSRILDFGDEIPAQKILHFNTIDGAKILLNLKNVSLLAMPLLKVEDAICSYLEELVDD